MNEKERVEPRNVSLYPSDWKIVDEQDKYGAGTSAALRMIVRQWYEQQAARRIADALSRGPVPTLDFINADADVA